MVQIRFAFSKICLVEKLSAHLDTETVVDADDFPRYKSGFSNSITFLHTSIVNFILKKHNLLIASYHWYRFFFYK